MSSPSLRDTPLLRRAVTVPAILVAAIVLIPSMVVIAPLSIIIDLLRGRPRLPTLRVALFGSFYLAWEVMAVVASGVLWVASGFGLLLKRRVFVQMHRGLQVSWANSLLGALRTFLRMRLEITGTECVAPGPVIVFGRHASMVDTLLPAHIMSTYGHLDLRYVLKQELRWDPAVDIVGSRIPNHFVDRSGTDTAAELAKIGELAGGMGANECFTIFPEGSRFTEAKRTRAIERLDETDPVLAARARTLVNTMPPRPGGVLTVLRSAPGADVVIIAHTGFEGLAGVKDLWRAAPFRRPILVEAWRIPAAEIPETDEDRVTWIYDVWAQVDDWVTNHRSTDRFSSDR